jgi:hypothetical protein
VAAAVEKCDELAVDRFELEVRRLFCAKLFQGFQSNEKEKQAQESMVASSSVLVDVVGAADYGRGGGEDEGSEEEEEEEEEREEESRGGE